MSKKADVPKPENHERWIVSYADMLTLLFALFVVLYATGNPNTEKLKQVRESLDDAFNTGVLQGSNGDSPIFEGSGITSSIANIKSADLEAIAEEVGTFAQTAGLDGKIQIRSEADRITISLADNLLFDSGSAELKPGSQDVLLMVAGVLNHLPNDLKIEGHTDNVPVNSPDYPTNWELSAARSSTVLRFLVEAGTVSGARMELAGYAETHPIADNATAEGRALNRRADIVIMYPTQEDLERALSAAGAQP
ncbi:MAG: OmpA family protein [Dehalococcoidia bacterium]|nr:OmpA family protein [Dehalococcoidia bacterium]